MLDSDKEFLLDCARSEREDAQNETFRLTTKCSKLEEQLMKEQKRNNDLQRVHMDSMNEVTRGQSELKDTQERMQSSLIKIQALEKNIQLLTKEREEWVRKEIEKMNDGSRVEEARGGKVEVEEKEVDDGSINSWTSSSSEEARLLREKSNMTTKETKEKIIQEVVNLSEEEEEEEEEEEDSSSDEKAVVPEYTLSQVLCNLESVGANNFLR